jgi:hypothetical protein
VTHPLFICVKRSTCREKDGSVDSKFHLLQTEPFENNLPMNMSDSSTGEVSIFICISSLSVLILIKGRGKFPKIFLEFPIVTDPREELDYEYVGTITVQLSSTHSTFRLYRQRQHIGLELKCERAVLC